MTDDRDDRIDEMLVLGARDYNEPGSVPREEMWARIAAARPRGRAQAPRGRGPIDGAEGVGRRSWSGLLVWPGVGVAAAAVLILGITIGRQLERAAPSLPAPGAKGNASVATATQTIKAHPDSGTGAGITANGDSLLAKIREETDRTGQTVRRLATGKPEPAASRTPALPSDRSGAEESSALAYHLVVLQHLAGSEAMITAFRTSARRGEVDAQMASWSRDLLSTTRMLEASPAADDPTMKRLLEDLDLVIGQIVIYVTHGTNNPEELDLIEQSITSRGVITKLRTVPARTVSAGS